MCLLMECLGCLLFAVAATLAVGLDERASGASRGPGTVTPSLSAPATKPSSGCCSASRSASARYCTPSLARRCRSGSCTPLPPPRYAWALTPCGPAAPRPREPALACAAVTGTNLNQGAGAASACGSGQCTASRLSDPIGPTSLDLRPNPILALFGDRDLGKANKSQRLAQN